MANAKLELQLPAERWEEVREAIHFEEKFHNLTIRHLRPGVFLKGGVFLVTGVVTGSEEDLKVLSNRFETVLS